MVPIAEGLGLSRRSNGGGLVVIDVEEEEKLVFSVLLLWSYSQIWVAQAGAFFRGGVKRSTVFVFSFMPAYFIFASFVAVRPVA